MILMKYLARGKVCLLIQVEKVWEDVSTTFWTPFTRIIWTFKQCVLGRCYTVFIVFFTGIFHWAL